MVTPIPWIRSVWTAFAIGAVSIASAGQLSIDLPSPPIPAGSASLFYGDDARNGFISRGQPGEPRLPERTLSILLPPQADPSTVTVSISGSKEVDEANIYDMSPGYPGLHQRGSRLACRKAHPGWPRPGYLRQGRVPPREEFRRAQGSPLGSLPDPRGGLPPLEVESPTRHPASRDRRQAGREVRRAQGGLVLAFQDGAGRSQGRFGSGLQSRDRGDLHGRRRGQRCGRNRHLRDRLDRCDPHG